MFYRNQKISPNGESLLKWEYDHQYISDDGEFGQMLTWPSMPRHASSSSFFEIFEGFFPFLQELRRFLHEGM